MIYIYILHSWLIVIHITLLGQYQESRFNTMIYNNNHAHFQKYNRIYRYSKNVLPYHLLYCQYSC
jgi:hypothetical protein